jgi:hypothetical protein
VDKNNAPSYAEIFNVLKMTEFFLYENFFKFHNLAIPESRTNLWRFFENEDDEKTLPKKEMQNAA